MSASVNSVPKAISSLLGRDAVSSHGAVIMQSRKLSDSFDRESLWSPLLCGCRFIKVRSNTLIGPPWKVDPIHRHEVLTKEYPELVKVVGKVFDVTPPELITAVITEAGLLHPSACVFLMWQMKMSQKLNGLSLKWSSGEL